MSSNGRIIQGDYRVGSIFGSQVFAQSGFPAQSLVRVAHRFNLLSSDDLGWSAWTGKHVAKSDLLRCWVLKTTKNTQGRNAGFRRHSALRRQKIGKFLKIEANCHIFLNDNKNSADHQFRNVHKGRPVP